MSWRPVLLCAAALLLVAGCGQKREQDKEPALQRRERETWAIAMNSRLEQLERKLEEVERENLNQREWLASARRDAEALRKHLGQAPLPGIEARALETSVAAAIAASEPDGGIPEDADLKRLAEEKRIAQDKALSWLALLVFVLVLVAWGVKMNRDRQQSAGAEGEAPSPDAEPQQESAGGSYTYPPGGASGQAGDQPPPADSVPPPVDGE